MSSGTSGGNIITDAAATYAARTWVDVVKVNAYGPMADASLDTYVGANWFNNVDDNLIQISEWFNGTGIATEIKANTATFTNLNVDDTGYINNLEVSNLSGMSTLVVGGEAISNADANAADLGVGTIEAVAHGISIFSTSVAKLSFVDVANVGAGYVQYTHASDTLTLGTAASNRLHLTSSALSPAVDNAVTFGSGAMRYASGHFIGMTLYSTANLGNGLASTTLTRNHSTATDDLTVFQANSVVQWRQIHKATSGDFALQRYVGGVFSNETLFAFATHDVSFPAAITGASTLTLGSGSGSPSVTMNGATGGSIVFRAASTQTWGIAAGTDFQIDRYSGGVLQDSVVFAGAGGTTIPSTLTVGSSSAAGPLLSLSKSAGGTSSFSFFANAVVRWAFLCDSSANMLFRRYNSSGIAQATATFSSTDGNWNMPWDVTLSGATRTFSVGDNTGAATIVISKTTGNNGTLEFFSNGVRRFVWKMNTSQNLALERYDASAVLQDTVTIANATGRWSFPAQIGVDGSSASLRMGTGVPSNGVGSNGDYFFRTDAAAATAALYVRIGGAWAAV